ncbi:MAG: hypothetical protein BMS9Abin20_0604 [Acidimicrobiia bacterium]|nr:MAG: hypothetical protein BMS9Abin20_0604 [Acidimicrobiia bacterium]
MATPDIAVGIQDDAVWRKHDDTDECAAASDQWI